MGAQIFEFWGRGIVGSPVMAHLVDIGAHDGHGRNGPQAIKVAPKRVEQYKSWFAPAGAFVYEGGNPVIAQVFFPFGDSGIDNMTDRVALDALIAHLRFSLGQNNREELEFVGYADPRGAASFNAKLARIRAEQVHNYVQRGVNRNSIEELQHSRYKSSISSMGESYPTGDYKADRRVDVVLRSITVRQNINFQDQPLVVPGDYKGPLTRKLQFRGYGGGSVSEILGVETMEIEIRNPRTGKSAFYQYYGMVLATPSPIPVGVGLPDSGYTEKEIPLGFGMVDVDDFAGPGGVIGVSAGKSGATLIFSGPKLHGTKKLIRKNGWEVVLDGWSVQFPGGSLGGGYWKKLSYNSVAERDKALREAQERAQRGREIHERFGPRI